jgi:two-component system sensor histidine kinase PilS (NtrC family)
MTRLRKQLFWLTLFRAVALTTLLASFIVIELLTPRAAWDLKPFYVLLGATFVLTVLYLLLHRFTRWMTALAYLQFLGDVLIVSGLVWATNGLFSPFTILYFVVILLASLLLFRQGALWFATASFVAYGVLAFMAYYGVSPPPLVDEEKQFELSLSSTYYRLFLHMFGFYTVAYLTSYLSESVRRTGMQIEERTSQLRKLEALNRLIVESISSALVTTDEEGRITFANKAAVEILGRPSHELQGSGLEGLMLPAGTLKEAVGALERVRAHRMEVPYAAPSGRTAHLGVAASRLAGPAGGFLFLAEDLTELKRLEGEVRFKDRMAAVGEMAAGLAHEIRNPLASMSGSAQVLRRDLELSDDQERLMGIILKESQRLDGIIRDFLDYARTGVREPREIDLAEVAQETLHLMRGSSEMTDGHQVRFEGGAAPCIADPNQMRTVAWNLLRNALRAMPDGGELTVRAGAEGNVARLEVTDTGCGMTKEEQQRAMQPFRGTFRGGAGLGLSIVYRIVQDHGGWVTIRSSKGEGTEVTVTLPREPGAAEAAPAEEQAT